METRTQRLKSRLLASPFEVCAERAVLWTESQRRTEGRPQVIRNALALKNVLDNMTVIIADDELIVGNRTSKPKGAPLFPEAKSFSIETQLDTLESRPIQPYCVGGAERRAIRSILPYWRGRSAWEMAFRLMPPDLQCDVFKLVFTIEAEFANGIGHFIVGNPNLLTKGFGGIREEARQKLGAASGSTARQRDFWEAVAITSDAAIAFAARFAAEARRMLGEENDPKRRDELLRIALICDRVPEHPPRDFRESIQAVWFNQLICQIECGGFAISPGRLDQLLYPFYKRDLVLDKITAEKAKELIECLYIKMSGVVNVLDTIILPVTSGPPIAQSLTIGGMKEDGGDATNELTWLFLDALDDIRTVWPNLAVRFNSRTPHEFMSRVCDTVRRGATMSLFNDDIIMPAMVSRGVPTREARDYAIVGCVEPTTSGSAFGSTDSNLVNIARCLELAMKNGDGTDFFKDLKYLTRAFGPYFLSRNGRRSAERGPQSNAPTSKTNSWANYIMLAKYLRRMAQRTRISLPDLYRAFRGRGVGVKSGDPRFFKSIDDLLEAYRKQVAWAVERMVAAMHYAGMAHAELKPTPFISSTIDDCVAQGRDVTWGGARYNFTGPQAVGLADVADSLAAVKTLVFDRHKVSMGSLIEAMGKNFEGAEPLRHTLINKAPKYGNDDEIADTMAKEAAAIYCREVQKHTNFRGGRFRPGIYSLSAHLVFGIFTGATPDGRRMGEPLCSGVSPSSGRETKGPTAIMKSAAKIDNSLITNGCVLTMAMNPDLVSGDENLEKFAQLNRSYFDLGGLHVQYNIVSADTLREAQRHPEKYRGLVVRVAGYNGLFTQLDRATQNDIIARTTHGCDNSQLSEDTVL